MGNERATTKLINKKAKVTEIIVEFTFDNIKHVLIRRKKESYNEIYIDDKKVKNSDLAREFFTSKDIFLTIFNPGYFSAMTPKKAKEFLNGIMKDVDKEEILNQLGDFLKEKLIRNNFLLNSVTFLKDKRSELAELKDNTIYLEGVIDGQSTIEIPALKSFDNTELNGLKEQLESTVVKNDMELTSLEKELSRLNVEINNTPYEKLQLINIEQLQLEKSKLLTEYKDYKTQFDSLRTKTITCDKCGNEIDINEIEKERLANIMKFIITKGKAKATEIEEAKSKNHKLQVEYSEKINSYKLKKSKNIDNVKVKISQLKESQVEKNKDIEITREELKARINELQHQKNEVIAFNMNIANLEKQKIQTLEKIKNFKEELSNNKLKIKEVEFLIDAAKQFNSTKLKKQTEFIDNYLNKVKLQFERLTNDGELKDDFKITYEGIPFNALSNAERIKAGLEISNLVMNLLGIKIPVFIDNAESIIKIPNIDTQKITAKVVAGKELGIA